MMVAERDGGAEVVAAERALLGLLLTNQRKTADAAAIVKRDDFSESARGMLFAALVEIDLEGGSFDPLPLAQALQSRGLLQRIGGPAVLLELERQAHPLLDLEQHARLVADHGMRRRALEVLDDLGQQLRRSSGNSASLVAAAQSRLEEATERAGTGDFVHAQVVINEALDILDSVRHHGGGVSGLRTGFPDLDRMLTGLHGGELIILAARPGCGKTACGLNMATHAALRENTAVAVFSLEMPRDQLGLRMLASEGRVSLKRMREGGLADEDYTRINDASARIAVAPLYIEDIAELSPSDIRARLRRLKRKVPNLGLVVVDYLQLVDGSADGDRFQSREQDVARCSRAFKTMSKEFGVPFLVLAQLGRKAEERRGRPMLSDLRESGSIESDADVVLFLWKEEGAKEDARDTPAARAYGTSMAGRSFEAVDLIVAKQRNGPTGVVPLSLFKELTRFESRTAAEEPNGPISSS